VLAVAALGCQKIRILLITDLLITDYFFCHPSSLSLQSNDPVPHGVHPIGQPQPYYREREDPIASSWI